ncbi:MAG: SDR family oxidoreductase [Planctomycetia bacterium]
MARRTLNGKRILITGATSGIGRSLAVEAAKRGGKVFLTGRNEERLNEVLATIRAAGGTAEGMIADVTEAADRDAAVHQCEQKFGGLDLLVNNAGVGATGHFQYAAPDRLKKIFDVNFFGPAELTRLAIPLLKAGDDPCIVMIGSVVGRRAMPARPEYSASKFALVGLTEALRAELSKDNVEVTLVSPGLTGTSFEENMIENHAKLSLKKQRTMTSEEVAVQVWNGVERRKNELTLTFKGKLLLLINRLAPRFIDRMVARRVKQLYAAETATAAKG